MRTENGEFLSGTYAFFYSLFKWVYYSTIAPFYHSRAKERAKYTTLLHCRIGQKCGLKRSDKMAVQNEPNFALFTCKARKFIMSSLVTWHFFHFNQSNKRHLNGFACALYVFRAGIMESIRCKMDFENYKPHFTHCLYYMFNHWIRCMYTNESFNEILLSAISAPFFFSPFFAVSYPNMHTHMFLD